MNFGHECLPFHFQILTILEPSVQTVQVEILMTTPKHRIW